jgi:hypothetical protein
MSGAISGTTLGIMAGVGAAGSIGGALIGANAAGNAADTQANAADRAAQLQYQASQNALQFQEQEYNQQQQNLQPWLRSGGGALTQLDYLLGIGGNPMTAAGYGQGSAQAPTGAIPPQLGSYPGSGVTGNPIISGPYSLDGSGGSIGPTGGVYTGGQTGTQPPQLGSGFPRPNPMIRSAVGVDGGNLSPSGSGSTLAPGAGQFGVGPTPTGGAPTLGAQGPPGFDGAGFGVNTGLGGYGSLMQPFGEQFSAPTGLTEQNDPGYQARLNLGSDALQRSAAARGGLLTGNTAKALDTYAQDYASNEYGNVYNRAYNQYATRYNQYEQNQTNQYNRLASLAGVGQQTAQQLGMLGNQAASGISSNLLNTAGMMGQDYQNAAAANASGMVGSANAWNSALGGIGGNVSQLAMMQMLMNGGGGWNIGY